MKKQYIIIGILLLLNLLFIAGYYLMPYWTLEGKYRNKDSGAIYEFKDGYFIDGEKKFKYSIRFRIVYIKLDNSLIDELPVRIYSDHLEMPEFKGMKTILEPIDE